MDNTHLCAIDKLSQGDVSVVTENVNILEIGGSILKLDAQEVADIRRGPTAKFNRKGGSIVSYWEHISGRIYECGTRHTDAGKFRVLLSDSGLAEERNEWLVGGLDQHELERVTIKGNALQRRKDSVQKRATSN